MFKNKSGAGVPLPKNERAPSDQFMPEWVSPISPVHKNMEHTFAKAKRTLTHHVDRSAMVGDGGRAGRNFDQVDLECDETLEVLDNLAIGKPRHNQQIDQNLECEQQLAPIGRSPRGELSTYVQRLQILLLEYMRRDIQKNQYIRKLQDQRFVLAQTTNRQDDGPRQRPLFWK